MKVDLRGVLILLILLQSICFITYFLRIEQRLDDLTRSQFTSDEWSPKTIDSKVNQNAVQDSKTDQHVAPDQLHGTFPKQAAQVTTSQVSIADRNSNRAVGDTVAPTPAAALAKYDAVLANLPVKAENVEAKSPRRKREPRAKFDFDIFWKKLTTLEFVPPQKHTHKASFLQSEVPKGSPRNFYIADLRKDFTGAVSDAFYANEVVRTKDEKNFDIWWSKSFDVDQEYRYLDSRFRSASVLLNHIPYLRFFLGEKVPLALTHQKCETEFGRDKCKFIAPAFVWPEQRKEFREEFGSRKKPGELWICKAANLFGGKHIYLIDPTERNCPTKRKDIPVWVVQKYISDVLLWDERKIDLRIWMLITSIKPFRAYISQHGFLKAAAKKYDPSPDSYRDMCIHSTAPEGVGADCAEISEANTRKAPPSTAKKPFMERLAPFGGWDGDPMNFYGDFSIWDNIERTCVATLLLVWKDIQQRRQEMADKGFHFRSFAFISYDVILQRDGSAVVEELNTNGFFVGEKSAFGSAQRFTEQGLAMVGVRGYDRTEYEDEVAQRIDEFCVNSIIVEVYEGCTDDDRKVLWDYEDEDHHKHNWKPAFPPLPPSTYVTPGEKTLSQRIFDDVRRFWEGSVSRHDGLLWNYMRVNAGLSVIDFRVPNWYNVMYPLSYAG
eukprot:Rmarinus@m.29019